MRSLLSLALEPTNAPIDSVNEHQRQIHTCFIHSQEPWTIVSLYNDFALAALNQATHFSNMKFHEQGQESIEEELKHGSTIFECALSADEWWPNCAKACAEIDPLRAIEAF